MGFLRLHSKWDGFRKLLKLDVKINPTTVSALSVVLSIGAAYNLTYTLVIVLLLDLLDGMIARGRDIASSEGLLVDYACDRYSEFIIFGILAMRNPLLILLPAVNTLLTLKNIQDKRYMILPLRQILLLLTLVGL